MKKIRIVTIKRADLYKDLERATYKRSEVGLVDTAQQVQDASSVDTEDKLDQNLVDRFIMSRDGKIRKNILFALRGDCMTNNYPISNYTHTRSNDDAMPSWVTITATDKDLEYKLWLDNDYDDAAIPIFAEYAYEYILKGITLDWYRSIGLPEPYGLLDEADNCLTSLVSLARGRSYIQRPLQPFGHIEP